MFERETERFAAGTGNGSGGGNGSVEGSGTDPVTNPAPASVEPSKLSSVLQADNTRVTNRIRKLLDNTGYNN